MRWNLPTIFIKNGFRFFFYSNEGTEPPHIHIIGRGGEMKVWLNPVKIARSYKLSSREQKQILKTVEKNVNFLLMKWSTWHEPNS